MFTNANEKDGDGASNYQYIIWLYYYLFAVQIQITQLIEGEAKLQQQWATVIAFKFFSYRTLL